MVDGLGRMPGDGSPARAWSGAASIMLAADRYASVLPEPLADSAGATARLVLAHATANPAGDAKGRPPATRSRGRVPCGRRRREPAARSRQLGDPSQSPQPRLGATRAGTHDRAHAEFVAVLAARHRMLGAEHPSTLSTRHALGLVRHAQGRHRQAEADLHDTLTLRGRILGHDHPKTLATRHEYARVLHTLSRLDQARAEFDLALRDRERVLGDAHPDTIATRDPLTALDQGPPRNR